MIFIYNYLFVIYLFVIYLLVIYLFVIYLFVIHLFVSYLFVVPYLFIYNFRHVGNANVQEYITSQLAN